MTKLILLGLVTPVIVYAAVMIAAWRPWRRGEPRAGVRWAGAAALALAWVPAFLAVERWPGVPPHVTWHWVAWLGPIAAVAGTADALVRVPAPARLLGAMALAAVCGGLLVGDWVDRAWSWRVVTTAVITLVVVAVNRAASRQRGAAVPLSLWAAATGASIVLLGSGSAKLPQLAGAVASCMGVVVVLAWWRPTVSLSRGGATVVAVLLPGLLFSGYFSSFTEIHPWVYVLAALAPAAICPAAMIRLDTLRAWQAVTIRVALAAIPAAIPAAVAALALLRPETDSPYPY